MKRWRGLVCKEWALVKWFAIALIAINIGITVLSSSHVVLGRADDSIPYSFVTSGLWFLLHIYMGIVLVAVSYSRERPRVDIWLHSPAPYGQLVGAKAIVAVGAVTGSLLSSGIVIAVFNIAGGYWGGISILNEVLVLLSLMVVVVLNSMLFIVITLFFLQVDQVLKQRMGKFSIMVTVVLFNLSVWMWVIVHIMDWFQVVKEMGPIYGVRTATNALPKLYETDFVLAGLVPVPESAILTVGSLLLYGFFISMLFIGGAALFDKKVRL